jgi:hypothetical protein
MIVLTGHRRYPIGHRGIGTRNSLTGEIQHEQAFVIIREATAEEFLESAERLRNRPLTDDEKQTALSRGTFYHVVQTD